MIPSQSARVFPVHRLCGNSVSAMFASVEAQRAEGFRGRQFASRRSTISSMCVASSDLSSAEILRSRGANCSSLGNRDAVAPGWDSSGVAGVSDVERFQRVPARGLPGRCRLGALLDPPVRSPRIRASGWGPNPGLRPGPSHCNTCLSTRRSTIEAVVAQSPLCPLSMDVKNTGKPATHRALLESDILI